MPSSLSSGALTETEPRRARTLTVLLAGGVISSWLVVVSWAVFTNGVDGGVQAAIRETYTPLYCGLGLCIIVYWWERAKSPDADLLAPTLAFPVMYALWFLIGSMDLLPRDGSPIWEPTPTRVPLLAGLGLLSYLAGTRVAGWTVPRRPSLETIRSAFATWHPTRARIVLGLAFAAFLFFYGSLVRHIGVPMLTPNPGVARLLVTHYGYLVGPLFTVLLFFVPASLGWMYSSPDVTRYDRWWIIAANIAIPSAIFGLAIRGQVLEPCLLALITLHYVRKPMRVRSVIITGLLALMFLSVVGLWRDVHEYGLDAVRPFAGTNLPAWMLIFGYIYTYVRDSVSMFGAVLENMPDFIPFQLGGLHARPFLAYIPGQHESSDAFFKRILYREFEGGGEPATLLGSFYGDFGVLGIIIMCFLLGLLVQMVYRKLASRPSSMTVMGHVWLLHACFLSLFGNIFPYPSSISVPLAMWSASLVLNRRSPAR